MYKIITIFRNETVYFYQRLDNGVRRILLSNIFKTFQSPLVTTFLNAFVWRMSGSIMGVVLYNVGLYTFLPIAFFINGLLLKHVHIRKLIAWGAIFSGMASAAFIFFGRPNIIIVFFYGCIWGLGNGFYWANRNYLELKETFSEVRLYFYGILQSISSIASILVPLLAGWFIVFGSYSHLYSNKLAYWILFTFSFILCLLCGRVIFYGTFKSPILENILVKKINILNKRRILNIASGFVDGVPFISTLLILLVLGNEGILGTVTATVSLVTALAMYLYGRKAKQSSELTTVLISSALFFISGFCLILFPIKAGVISYVLLSGIAVNFFSMTITPILFSLSEKEMKNDANSLYSFIFDNELFLNIGRLISLLIVVGFSFWALGYKVLIYSQVSIGIVFILIFSFSFFVKNREN